MSAAAKRPVPVFPLSDVVLFPHAPLPLHVFELRYRTMVRDALSGDREFAIAASHVAALTLESKARALDAIELCAGANITQKAMAFVRSQPGGATLSHDDAHEAASTLLASFRD